jgi:hypothetical protein
MSDKDERFHFHIYYIIIEITYIIHTVFSSTIEHCAKFQKTKKVKELANLYAKRCKLFQ